MNSDRQKELFDSHEMSPRVENRPPGKDGQRGGQIELFDEQGKSRGFYSSPEGRSIDESREVRRSVRGIGRLAAS